MIPQPTRTRSCSAVGRHLRQSGPVSRLRRGAGGLKFSAWGASCLSCHRRLAWTAHPTAWPNRAAHKPCIRPGRAIPLQHCPRSDWRRCRRTRAACARNRHCSRRRTETPPASVGRRPGTPSPPRSSSGDRRRRPAREQRGGPARAPPQLLLAGVSGSGRCRTPPWPG